MSMSEGKNWKGMASCEVEEERVVYVCTRGLYDYTPIYIYIHSNHPSIIASQIPL